MKRLFYLYTMIFFLIFLDQFTKGLVQQYMVLGQSIPIIDGLFNISFVLNRGVAFGIGHNAPEWFRGLFFIFLPVCICLFLAYHIFLERHKKLIPLISYSLILAGAIGNLLDRILLGQVVDFLDFYYSQYHFHTFNIADSLISIAAGLLIIQGIQDYREEKKHQAPN